MWRSVENVKELAFFPRHVGSKSQTQVIKYGHRYSSSFTYTVSSSTDILLLPKILFQPLWSYIQEYFCTLLALN